MKTINEYLFSKKSDLDKIKSKSSLVSYMDSRIWTEENVQDYFDKLGRDYSDENFIIINVEYDKSLIRFKFISSKPYGHTTVEKSDQIRNFIILVWNALSDAEIGTNEDDTFIFNIYTPGESVPLRAGKPYIKPGIKLLHDSIKQKDIPKYIGKATNYLIKYTGAPYIEVGISPKESTLEVFNVSLA